MRPSTAHCSLSPLKLAIILMVLFRVLTHHGNCLNDVIILTPYRGIEPPTPLRATVFKTASNHLGIRHIKVIIFVTYTASALSISQLTGSYVRMLMLHTKSFLVGVRLLVPLWCHCPWLTSVNIDNYLSWRNRA